MNEHVKAEVEQLVERLRDTPMEIIIEALIIMHQTGLSRTNNPKFVKHFNKVIKLLSQIKALF